MTSRILRTRSLLLALLAPAAAGGLAAQEVELAAARLGPVRLERTEGGELPAGWRFEAVGYARDVGRRRVVRVGEEGEAAWSWAEDGPGVVLEGRSGTARGDLVSPGFGCRPYRVFDVTVEYEVLEGGTHGALFAGLRPVDDRERVDLAALPIRAVAGSRRETVRLHSNVEAACGYAVAVSVAGDARVRVVSIAARETGAWTRPTRPILVLDIRSADPDHGPNGNFQKVADVFGFPAVEYLHYTEVGPDEVPGRIAALDPALLVLPGLVSTKGVDREQVDAFVRAAVRHEAPVVGVCLGHQVLARALGAELRRAEVAERGPRRVVVSRPDPVLDGLPRGRAFNVSQSHAWEVVAPIGRMENVASSADCGTQVFRYRGKPWYTFQGHIERGWEVASPDACVLWKRLLRRWDVVGDAAVGDAAVGDGGGEDAGADAGGRRDDAHGGAQADGGARADGGR